MPPRYTYWTIIFGNQPTSFRAATRDELLPTFRQIQSKHPDAVMMWFASGRLWRSEEEARAARFARRRPEGDRRPEFRGPLGPPKPRSGEGWKPRSGEGGKPVWKDRPSPPPPPKPRSGEGGRPEWKDRAPLGPPRPRSGEGGKPEWKDRPHDPRGPRPESRGPRPEWKDRAPLGPPKPRSGEGGKPEWKAGKPPGGEGAPPKAKDRWRNRPEGEQRRSKEWRPGGEHKDPRDRFKVPRDVKRARFKDRLRRDHSNPKPPKKKDEE